MLSLAAVAVVGAGTTSHSQVEEPPAPESAASAPATTPTPDREPAAAASPSPTPAPATSPPPPTTTPPVATPSPDAPSDPTPAGPRATPSPSTTTEPPDTPPPGGAASPAPQPQPQPQPQPSTGAARGGDSASAPRGVPRPPRTTFEDVSTDPTDPAFSAHARAIEWLAAHGAGLGWGLAEESVTFDPDREATRADLAAFLYRAAGLPLHHRTEETSFDDVEPRDERFAEITWLTLRGVALGDDDGAFGPDVVVSTGEAANAVHHLADGPVVVLARGLSFDPVTARSEFADAAEWLTSVGVDVPMPDAAGDAELRKPISRGALASLLMAAHESGVTLARGPSLVDALGKRSAAFSPDGLLNGRLPASTLCDVAWEPGTSLACHAAADLALLNEAFAARFGVDVPITDGYRDLAGQWLAKARHGHLAATPGTSMHGWGAAIDLDGSRIPGGFAGQAYSWLVANAPSFGWALPRWASPVGSKPEPWHLEHLIEAPAATTTSAE
ncbi:M15 family metallopeptidase [Demequina sp. NBRC 110053]|uniref:M15 family metallopeptidase n=1 Tax=Demequina sp. NBRC 110053 TaxID=1570342 RepID=UPI001186A39D|nr:M15 family metallopeptidase [Demequina sp. NBRC 110053]